MTASGDKTQIKKINMEIGQYKAQLTRASKYATEQLAQVLVDIDGIQLRMEELSQGLQGYKEKNLELMLMTASEIPENDDTEEKYFSVMSVLRKALRRGSSPPKAEEQKDERCTYGSSKLPQLDIAEFDGKDITQYRPFIDMFTAIIDNNERLSSIQKLIYLRRYLKGNALTLIEGLPLVNESYKQALDLIKNRYDNTCLCITHHVNTLLDYQPISKGGSAEIRHLVSVARQHLGALKNLGQETQHWDMIIIPILLRKLDTFSCRAFYADRDTSELPTIEGLFKYLEKRAISFEESSSSIGKPTQKYNFTKSTNIANISNSKVANCRFCQEPNHKIFLCKKFKSLSAQDRFDFVKKSNLCQICLNAHMKKCLYHFKCAFCKSKEHNTLLHIDDTVCNLAHSKTCLVNTNMILLPTIKVRFQDKSGSFVTARGLLDSGSQVSFINSDLIRQLNVPTFDCNVNITALGHNKSQLTQAVELSIHSIHDSYSCSVVFSVVDNITSFLPQNKCPFSNVDFPDTIQLADNDFHTPGAISFLVSADILFKILLPDKIEMPNHQLVLFATRLGYIVSGNVNMFNVCQKKDIPYTPCFNASVALLATNNISVDTILLKFWEEQHIPESIIINDDQNVCEIEFKKSVKLIDNRFQVSLPLKVPLEDVVLGDSFNVALQRLNYLCKKFIKNPELKVEYTKFIQEYVALGHAKKIDLFMLERPFERCYFLPHHAVHKDSITTKVRTVFDASAKTNLNISLNDILYAGPVVQRELFDILILFRTYKYVVMTDIKQMYRQVRVDPAHVHLQLILWKEHLNDALSCFQLETVTYGVTSSSFLATRCLVELAHRYGLQYPLAAKVLLNNSYIDDFLYGAPTIEEAKKISDELIKLTSLGGFELHKWCASHPNILSGIPSSSQYFQDKQLDSGESTVKALGLSLNTKSDQFIISPPCGRIPNVNAWTKRSMLSFIGTFFDPLGLVGPIVTRAKEFLQKIWQLKIDWDVPLPDELSLVWNLFVSNLRKMEPIYLKRDVMINNADCMQLIGYCDASSIAYGACIYIRAIKDNMVSVNLLCSKSRIAPLKGKSTIPRLELNACLLLAKLYTKVKDVLDSHSFDNQILYSDSKVALCWLQNPPAKDCYVSNRVRAITEQTQECIWSHVSGAGNPADCLSRGIMPSDLSLQSLWWNGPVELQELNYIPRQFDSKDINVNITSSSDFQANCNIIDEVLPISKFSSVIKLQRVVCYVLRFIKNCRVSTREHNGSLQLTVKEYKQSMLTIIKHVQLLHFSKEINIINSGNVVKSNLKKLYPFVDKDGLMRVSGRLENENVAYCQKYPIILPKKCNLTILIIRQQHYALLHAGLKLTQSSLSQRYYIISATTVIKNIINKCVLCHKFRAQKAEQLMSSLPHDRVVPDRPFNKVGIDYCGPFDIKQSSIRRSIVTKGYVCVFVCFVTKCVHLELVSDLTTESFLAALKRFVSRRGLPHTIYCDNASTFKGANNQLKQLHALCKSQLHQSAVIDYCNVNSIDFKFIPSYSPTWGGLWEAAVKSAKYHFKRVIGKLLLTFEQFYSIIVQVESVLNSRPITPLSSDTSDFTYLTPGHFLINQPLTAISEPQINSDVNTLRFWKKCTKVQQDFWRAWHKSYLSQLLCRPKWYKVHPEIQEGMLVLLLSENLSPLNWPVARVVKTLPGRDGHVRAVEVKTKSGATHLRAISKVAVLPIYD